LLRLALFERLDTVEVEVRTVSALLLVKLDPRSMPSAARA
jgi:hypothetical protein